MFQRFWLCCGVYGNRDSLALLQQAVAMRPPDAVLFAGGIVAIPRHYHASATSEWSLTRDDTRFAEEFFSTLGSLGIFSAAVHGPTGAPLEEYLRLGMQAELTYPTVHFVHATLVEAGGLAFCGIGGSVAEGQLLGTDSYSRTTAEYVLRPLWRTKQPRKVLLLATPPPGPLGGPEGVPLVRDLIDSFHPELCVVTGRSERRGSERIGSTLVINPGCLADGFAAWLDWSLPAQNQVEFVNLAGATSPATSG